MGNLGRPWPLFSRHFLLYGRDVREVRRSSRGSIDGSTRVLFNCLTRSEQAASGNSKRDYNSECCGKFLHLATSLRRKWVLASELACSR